MVPIERNRVRQAFDRHAGEYETYAQVQKRVVTRFVEILQGEDIHPARVLDIGSGTGLLLGHLDRLYPGARMTGVDLAFGMCRTARDHLKGTKAFVTGDAERLPFADGSFDLVVSTSTLQWLEAPDAAFHEVWRVLVPGGRFVFALFGERTLHELRTCYGRASLAEGRGIENRTHSFLSAAEVRTALIRGDFTDCRTWSEFEREEYSDVPSLLRALRQIGAGNASSFAARGLTERRVMLTMMDIYQQEYASGTNIRATYEVVCGVGRKMER